MNSGASYRETGPILRHRTGVVIPVYLPQEIDAARGESLLRDTVTLCLSQLDDPADLCLSVDGRDFGSELADRLRRELGVSTCTLPENRGKLLAVTEGVRTLIPGRDLDYIAIVDQDGDHFGNELLNFVRAAHHIAREASTDRVLVLGRRASRHRPMGFLRGELEELADRVLLDALHYDAALTGKPLRLEYATTLEEFPDFHSGYKLLSRATAADVFLEPPRLAGVSSDGHSRHAVEAVIVVEALKSGAILGTIQRTTSNEQPISTFGRLDRCRLVADKIIWPCKRLGVPPDFVRQWLANHAPRLLLGTLAPEGRSEVQQIRRLVLEAFGRPAEAGDAAGLPPFI